MITKYIPLDFNYGTTLQFWFAIFGLLLENSTLKKILYSWCFGASISGILIHCNNFNDFNILKIVTRYVIPLTLSVIFFNSFDNTKLNILFFVPMFIYILIVILKKTDLIKIYGDKMLFYFSLSVFLSVFYFVFEKN